MKEPTEAETILARAAEAVSSVSESALNGADDLIDNVAKPLEATFRDIGSSFLDHTPFLLAGCIVFTLTCLAARYSNRAGHRLVRDRRIRQSLKDLAVKLLTIAIWIVGLLLTAMMWFPGLTPTSALGGLGLLSVAVGFAFQDIFENFFAGVLLLWQFPFEKGDFIECEGFSGSVEDINIRMTELRLTSGELVLVPNSVLFKNPVTVLTDQHKRRQRLICGIAYHENVERVVSLLSETVSQCSSIDATKAVQCYPCEFNSSSVDIELTWWTDPNPGQMRASKAEVLISVKAALDKAGIEIPFPYRTLTFKDPAPS